MEVYKKGQGNRARALVAIAAGLMVVFGVSEAMDTVTAPGNYIMAACVVVLIGGGGMFFPFFHRRTADFLIDTQAEMKKVAWPAWVEVRGSTVVVITSVVIMAVFLTAVDLMLKEITELVGIFPEM